MTVLLTTHYMEEADALCDRVALMHLGPIRAEGIARRARRRRSARTRRSRTCSATTPAAASTAPPRTKGGLREIRTTRRTAARRWLSTPPPDRPRSGASFPSRVATFCLVELQKLRHDRTELFTRAVQPVLWLLIFGETFNRLHAIPTGGVPYLDFLAPGIIAQSGMFVAIFYGIQIIWERDAGVLTKLLVTPTPRSALILGKSFAAGIRAIAQVVSCSCSRPSWASSLTHEPAAHPRRVRDRDARAPASSRACR